MKYHNNFGEPSVISGNLHKARMIHEAIHKNHVLSIVTPKKKRKKPRKTTINMVDHYIREYETLWDDELCHLSGVKVISLWLVPNKNYEFVHLNDNLVRSVCIWANFPFVVKRWLTKFLQAYVDLFAISPYEIPDRDPDVACYQCNIDPLSWYVAQRRRHRSPKKVGAAMSMVQGLLGANFYEVR